MSNEFEAVAHEYRFGGDRWTPCSKADFDKKRLAFMTAARIEFRELFTGDDLRQLAEQRAELLELATGALSYFEARENMGDDPNEESLIASHMRGVLKDIANATQQRNATGGEG